eukprot:m.155960 g.155960  ORF g.155960 m.155960 type:complete len:219 (+) comp38683_c0_seq2:1399-2055(+)
MALRKVLTMADVAEAHFMGPMVTGSETYLKIERMLNLRNYQVISLQQIMSTDVYSKFSEEKEKLKAKRYRELREGKAIECLELFHGTKLEYALSIAMEGFKREYAGRKNGSKFGKGVYFARAAKMAMDYTEKDEASGDRVLLLCEVLVGMYTIGSQGMDMPPAISGYPRNQNMDHLFDSTVNDLYHPEIFVCCYKGDHYVFPKYLIRLREAPADQRGN